MTGLSRMVVSNVAADPISAEELFLTGVEAEGSLTRDDAGLGQGVVLQQNGTGQSATRRK